jgi:protein tyrosine phosphatase
LSFILLKRNFILKNGGMEYRLIHYFYTGWPDYNVIEPKKLIDLIETINKHREHSFHLDGKTTPSTLGPTVVHCR